MTLTFGDVVLHFESLSSAIPCAGIGGTATAGHPQKERSTMNSTGYDPSDTIADGLAVFALSTDDDSVTESGAAAYRRVYRAVRQQMRPGDTCQLALPSMMVTPDRRHACFVIVLQDRVLVAYERGLFRRRTESLVIPIPSVTGIRQRTGSTAGPKGAAVLTICGEPCVTIALAERTADKAAGIIREILQPTVD